MGKGSIIFSVFGLILLNGLFLSNFVLGNPSEKLVLAQILFRHGERAPEQPYPLDPYTNETLYWPNGWGQLTSYGKEQQYKLGQFLRARYNSILSSSYNYKEVLVTSTDYDRTIMSADLALAGLYPKFPLLFNEYTYDNIAWEAVPVHTIGDGLARLMFNPKVLQNPTTCPRYFQLFYQKMAQEPSFIKFIQDNAEAFDVMREGTGATASTHVLQLVGVYMNTILVEKFFGLPIPAWAEDFLAKPSNLELLGATYQLLTLTEEMKRLVAGPMLAEWIQNMKNKLAGTESKNLFIYSGHDLNLANILNTLGLFEPTLIPEMSSTLMVELYVEKESGKTNIKIFYRDGVTQELKRYKIPGCENPCRLEELETKLENYISVNLVKDCVAS